MLLYHLYPLTTSNGVYQSTINNEFEESRATIDENIEKMERMVEGLLSSLGENPIYNLDMDEMNNLKNHVTKLGLEFFSKKEIPFELNDDVIVDLTPQIVTNAPLINRAEENRQQQFYNPQVMLHSPPTGKNFSLDQNINSKIINNLRDEF